MRIAIDGPSAAGKSTVAKLVAKKLGFIYVDTGAMYRSVTRYALNQHIDCQDDEAVSNLLKDISIKLDASGKVFLNNEDVTRSIRENDVNKNVSYVAANKTVRLFLIDEQRKLAKGQNVVMDGRDIGTYVLPDAEVKIFQVASVKERARRRYKENLEKGIACESLEAIEKDIERRDYIDSHRDFDPLKKADDAITLDTSNLTIDEVVDNIIKIAKEKGVRQ